MNAWRVEFLDKALKEFGELPADIRARFQRVFGLVAEMGQAALVMPYARHVQGAFVGIEGKGARWDCSRALCGVA